MSMPWYVRLGFWLCKKMNHPILNHEWIYNGYYHRYCKVCGRIVSERIKEQEK